MKILRECMLDNIRQNKRSSVAIIIALFLMTSMMSCFCGHGIHHVDSSIERKNGIMETGTGNCLMILMEKTFRKLRIMLP